MCMWPWVTVRFHRGYESCSALKSPLELTRAESYKKQRLRSKLSIKSKFTDVDYLLNCRRVKDAYVILSSIKLQL